MEKENERIKELIKTICSFKYEQEWFEFEENWFEPIELGEYVSALSNAATMCNQKFGYLIWGIDDSTHQITGTDFNQYNNYKNEPYQNFLARNLRPSINFKFIEVNIDGKRVIVLQIPAAEVIPTSFYDKRYIRIGSSKCNLSLYPQREIELFNILSNNTPTIETKKSKYQDLSFNKLFAYYGSRGIKLSEDNFIKNLSLKNKDGEFNILAQLLSDNSHIPLRITIFNGREKSDNTFSVREFGNTCLLYTLDDILRYGDVLNIVQTDETNRLIERKETTLFDSKAFREAIINAILHNKWVDENEPMISVFSNRIEVLSRGSLPIGQTKDGFFRGESIPVNPKLSEIFLQLHISEKSGRGVPKIVASYGKNAFIFNENSIVCTLPFYNESTLENKVENKLENKLENKANAKPLNKIANLILNEIRDNPNITIYQLHLILNVGQTTINNYLAKLKKEGYIKRIGSNKTGYWIVK